MRKLLCKIRFLLIALGVPWDNERLVKDIRRWKELLRLEGSDKEALADLMQRDKAFRSLFIYRVGGKKLYWRWVKLIYPPLDSLYIMTGDIGGGLYIHHGFSTYIAAEKIGENCWINQQVTIGYRDNTTAPIIGDNVMITCGAKVLGPITIGDNVTVGANAVVIRDCPPNSTWGGVPARRLK